MTWQTAHKLFLWVMLAEAVVILAALLWKG
jgi:hypothetical protein